MLDDLTHEQWFGWLNYFSQDPWDEKRQDDRNQVACLWSVAPHIQSDDFTPPGFNGPEYSNSEETKFEESVARIEALKKRVLNGQLNRKTSNHADDGLVADDARL